MTLLNELPIYHKPNHVSESLKQSLLSKINSPVC